MCLARPRVRADGGGAEGGQPAAEATAAAPVGAPRVRAGGRGRHSPGHHARPVGALAPPPWPGREGTRPATAPRAAGRAAPIEPAAPPPCRDGRRRTPTPPPLRPLHSHRRVAAAAAAVAAHPPAPRARWPPGIPSERGARATGSRRCAQAPPPPPPPASPPFNGHLHLHQRHRLRPAVAPVAAVPPPLWASLPRAFTRRRDGRRDEPVRPRSDGKKGGGGGWARGGEGAGGRRAGRKRTEGLARPDPPGGAATAVWCCRGGVGGGGGGRKEAPHRPVAQWVVTGEGGNEAGGDGSRPRG